MAATRHEDTVAWAWAMLSTVLARVVTTTRPMENQSVRPKIEARSAAVEKMITAPSIRSGKIQAFVGAMAPLRAANSDSASNESAKLAKARSRTRTTVILEMTASN